MLLRRLPRFLLSYAKSGYVPQQGNLSHHLYKAPLLAFGNRILCAYLKQTTQFTIITKYYTLLQPPSKMVRTLTFTLLAAALLTATSFAAPAEEKFRRVASFKIAGRDGELDRRQTYCGTLDAQGTCCCFICDCLDYCICDLICGELVGCDG